MSASLLCEREFERALHQSLYSILTKAEKRILNYVNNDKGTVIFCTAKINSCNVEKCIKYRKEGYLFLKLCVQCKLDSTPFCFSHMKNANGLCNTPGHIGTVFRRIRMKKTIDVLSNIARIGRNTDQSSKLKRSGCCPNEDSETVLTATVAKKKKTSRNLRNVDLLPQIQMKDPQHRQDGSSTI